MPIIVPIEENEVGVSGLTDKKFKAADYSGSGLEALGAGLAKVGDGGAQLATALDDEKKRAAAKQDDDQRALAAAAVAAAKLGDDHQRNIDDATVKKAYIAYSNGSAEQLYGDNGLFNQQGANAHAAFPDTVAGLSDSYDKAMALLDPTQQAAIAPILTHRINADVDLGATYVQQQGAAEQQQQSLNLQDTAARDAQLHADDPALFDHHLATGVNAIYQQKNILGSPDTDVEQQVARYKSGVYAGAIEALAAKDPVHAAGLFARYGSNLDRADKNRVQMTLVGASAGSSSLSPVSPQFGMRTIAEIQDSAAPPALPVNSQLASPATGSTTTTAPVTAVAGSTPDQVQPPALVTPPPSPPRTPLRTANVGGERVLAARISPADAVRLSGENVIATPAIRAAAQAQINKVRVASGTKEILAFGYLMPDGSIDVRPRGTAGSGSRSDNAHGRPAGLGKLVFIIHGHIESRSDGEPGDEGMVDEPRDPLSEGRGDSDGLFKYHVPVATVYGNHIGWRELHNGQLTFSVPLGAQSPAQLNDLELHLTREQPQFFKPLPAPAPQP